jgi:hypothetical protein
VLPHLLDKTPQAAFSLQTSFFDNCETGKLLQRPAPKGLKSRQHLSDVSASRLAGTIFQNASASSGVIRLR